MSSLTLSVKYRKNSGAILNPSELFALYLYGITIQAGDGTSFSNESVRFYIEAAQKEIEDILQSQTCSTVY